ncbi:MAG: DUF4097 family beta strand repeat protein [Anaerolineae bacterium]|nr:DUF4097 family beta strand repeat protein [Anaerolineae bacterium]
MSEYSWNLDAFDAIRIVAANGEFEIIGADSSQVQVEGIERNRHSFGAEPKIVGRWLYLNPFGGGSQWTIELPKSKAWTIEVACASGDVEIENVHARIGVQLGSGDVNLENCRGTFNVRAGSGDVTIENCVQSETPAAPPQPTGEEQAEMRDLPPGVPPMPPIPGIPPIPPSPPLDVNLRMGRRRAMHPDDWQDYGREWEEWGERFGEQVSHWAENMTRSFAFGFKLGSEEEPRGDGFHVRLGSGDVQLEEVDALVVSARVGSGDVQIEQGRIAELDVENSRGDIQIEGVLPANAWELVTRHGDVRLILPGDAFARVDAATRHGDIECEPPLVRVGRPGPESRHGGRMVGTIGAGQGEPADIHLESQHGDIQIEVERRPSRFQGQASEQAPGARRGASESPTPVVAERGPVGVTEAAEPRAAPKEPGTAQVYDSHLAILQALQAGEITVAEAEMLLRSLN